MVYTAREDIVTLLEAWSSSPTFAADANLTGEPAIGTSNDAEPTALESVHGRIRAIEESLNNIDERSFKLEDLHYRTTMRLQFTAQTAETKLKALMRQIRKCFNTNNELVDRVYHHRLMYSWNGTVKEGQVDVIVESIEEMVIKV